MTDTRTIRADDGGELVITWRPPGTRKQPGDVGEVRRGGVKIGHLIHSGRTSPDDWLGPSFGQCEAHYDGTRYGAPLTHETAAKRCGRQACRQFDSDGSAARFLDRIDRGEVC